jgi:hypothetical protein
MYTVATAQLPEPPEGADRVFIASNAVILLDGASAFAPDTPDPREYVDALGGHLRDTLNAEPLADLRGALAAAIEAAATDLQLTAGHSPSSTVAIARWSEEAVDFLVLGDSQIATPHGVIRDDRLDNVAPDTRAAYRQRLQAGHGYDDQHRTLLTALQTEQEAHRNKPDGYWIAEADPNAAERALTETHPTRTTPWLILATDGAYRPLDHLGIEVPPSATSAELRDLLRECARWEAESDPAGMLLPRSKQHDDKVIAVLRSDSPR